VLRLGGVVTHMLLSNEKIEFIIGDKEIMDYMPSVPALQPFNNNIILFLSEVSKRLLNDVASRQYPDIMAYAFWVRRASLERLVAQNRDKENSLGRGLAFHVTPANIPLQFAYSLTVSLLSGNANIVRLSQKDFPQTKILCDIYNDVLEIHPLIRSYISIIKYEHDDAITQELSNCCDIRIIWGGNRAIDEIRNAKLPPRSVELTFADRFSICVINSDEYLKVSNKIELAKDFFIDTYYSDQNACSSPRLIVWTGKNIKKAEVSFWSNIHKLVVDSYDLNEIQAVDKLVAFCRLAAVNKNIYNEKMLSAGNYVNVVKVDRLSSNIMDYKCSGGYFFEYETDNLSDLIPILIKGCQTISYFGINPNELFNLVINTGVKGVDRIVPLGKTMELSLQWEGMDLIEAMSRRIDILRDLDK